MAGKRSRPKVQQRRGKTDDTFLPGRGQAAEDPETDLFLGFFVAILRPVWGMIVVVWTPLWALVRYVCYEAWQTKKEQ
jgi:hypothetical protein